MNKPESVLLENRIERRLQWLLSGYEIDTAEFAADVRAVLAKLAEKAEPVAKVVEHYGFTAGVIEFYPVLGEAVQLPIGTQLYTNPPTTAAPFEKLIRKTSTVPGVEVDEYAQGWNEALRAAIEAHKKGTV